MANVLTVVWLVIGYAVTQTAAMVWVALLFPGPVGRAQERIARRPGRCFCVGLLFWVVSALVSTTLLSRGKAAPLQLLGWSSAGPMLVCSVLGGAAIAQIVARRIQGRVPGAHPISSLVGGAACTALADLITARARLLDLGASWAAT
jgi:hypothetical protein